MQDRVATVLILRSLDEIVKELKAIRAELHRLNEHVAREDPDGPPRYLGSGPHQGPTDS